MGTEQADTDFFWDLAGSFLVRDDVEQGTLMGMPCLRVGGDFFATAEHRTGELIAKLPAERVDELTETGEGQPFAPAGKVFREWVLVSDRDEKRWLELMEEAYEFNSGGSAGKSR